MNILQLYIVISYFNKIKGTDTGGEYGVSDLKEVLSYISDYKVYYKDDNGERFVWERNYDIIKW